MAYGDTYNVGTATLDSNDPKIVHVTGALLLSNAVKGDTFEYAGRRMSIASVPANGSFTMELAWPDAPFTDAAYLIIQDSPSRHPQLAVARTQRDLLERLRIFDQAKPIFGIREFGVNVPPLDYAAGEMLVIGSTPAGVFASKINAIARFTEEGGWTILTPEFGWQIISQADPAGSNIVRTFDGTSWATTTVGGQNPLGAYSAATTYKFLDLVTYQGSSWLYRNGTPSAGNAPPNAADADTNAHWQLNAKVGPQDTTPPPHIVVDPDPFPNNPFKFNVWARWSTLPYLDAEWVYTNASANRSYYGLDGKLRYVAANVPRFDTIFATGETGLLMERGKTNLILRSQEFNTGWNLDALTVTADATIAPDGTSTADKLTENTAANVGHRWFQSVSKAAAALPYSFSIYLKPAGRTRGRIVVYDGVATIAWSLDLTAGTISAPTVGAGWTTPSQFIESLPNGWFRLSVCATTPATTNITPLIYTKDAAGNDSYTGDGVSGFFAWGAQLEQHGRPTSYIATAASQVSRATDVMKRNIALEANQQEGTIYQRAAWRYAFHGNFTNIMSGLGNTAATFGTDFYTSRYASGFALSSGASVTVTVGPPTNSVKYAAGLKENEFILYANGAFADDTSGTMQPNINQISIGDAQWSFGGNGCDGIIMEFGYSPRRMPNAQYLAMTS